MIRLTKKRVIAAGIIPAGLEMMDKPMTAAVEDFVHAGYDLDAAAILRGDVGADDELQAALLQQLDHLFEMHQLFTGQARHLVEQL